MTETQNDFAHALERKIIELEIEKRPAFDRREDLREVAQNSSEPRSKSASENQRVDVRKRRSHIRARIS